MTRISDKDRVVWLLQEQGRRSNQSVRSTLNLSDDRYLEVKEQLLSDGLIEKVRGQGGCIQLTTRGMREKAISEATSVVDSEKGLYGPFLKVMEASIKENEEDAFVVNTSALRKSGKWSNPDITKISVRKFFHLRTHRVVITTYEIKQWKRWSLSSVFEAASQRQCAHEAYLVLEWAKNEEVLGLDEMKAKCGQFGVGLMILHPYYSSFRYDIIIEAKNHLADDDSVEEYLSYVFERNDSALQQYRALFDGSEP